MLKKFRVLFIVLIVEGASLMAVELMGAKLVAPFYGSSLYVWTAVLTAAIAGLAAGYYLGGIVSKKREPAKILIVVLAASAILVFGLPYNVSALIKLTAGLDLITGICITCLFLVVPVFICFGMVGPIAVKIMSVQTTAKGAVAGAVYFTSTFGGILSTFLFGCYLVPYAGLKFCALAIAVSLTFLLVIFAVWHYKNKYPYLDHATDQKDHTLSQNKPVQKKYISKKETRWRTYLYAVAEGAVVMIIELVSARMIAPYFGSSLFVWSVVIGFTLSGIALGYYLGGLLANKYEPLPALRWALLAASVFLVFMHYSSAQLTIAFAGTNFRTAIVCVSFLLVMPPLIFLGMVPTLLIGNLAQNDDLAGLITGRVYAASAVAGIVALILFGFYVIPRFGLTGPSIITGIAAGTIPFLKLISEKKYISLLFLVFVLLSLSAATFLRPGANVDVKYYSEGLLGQVLVADIYSNAKGTAFAERALFVNRIGETVEDKNTGNTKSDYIVYVSSITSKLPEHSKVLLLGLGGGSIANLLNNHSKFDVDVIELDERIADVAKDYFSLSNDVHVVIDDARHYIEKTKKKYDVIFFDVFRGDIPPAHVLSLESFEKSKSLLNENGLIIVNFYGFLSGDIGKAGRSIYKTLCAAGLNTHILPTNGIEEERNLLFISSIGNQHFNDLRFPLFLYGKKVVIDTMFVEDKTPLLNKSAILTDNNPVIDVLAMKATNNWRLAYNAAYTKLFLENGVPLFQ